MQKLAALIVSKHPDGFNFVRWDEDPHPSRKRLHDAYVAELVRTGHQVEIMAGDHIKLLSGPHA